MAVISRGRRNKRSGALLEVATCAVLAGLHIILMPSSSSGITLPKNSRRHRMPQTDYSIHEYEEASLD